jgi:hypothetical protein
MRFTGKCVNRKHPDAHMYSRNQEYRREQVTGIAGRHGVTVTRPNGDLRIRGSRRLVVVDPKTRMPIWQFTAIDESDLPTVIHPTPVAFF